jgi:putative transposase
MALPRSQYVLEGEEGVYHCYTRCVRRAFLYGFDKLTGRNFSHRKVWVVDRLRQIAAIFAIDVCGYSVMGNHCHTILRTRPDIVAGWSDEEVATRWLMLYPKYYGFDRKKKIPVEEQINGLASCPERITVLRKRLSNLSWFMGRLNEYIARAANKEDEVKGRFWESRFKCQSLLDDAAIIAGMVYVDLNPIRAGRAETPEDSDFTSIQERIRAWYKEKMATGAVSIEAAENNFSGAFGGEALLPENAVETLGPVSEGASAASEDRQDGWLCPIFSESNRRGILPITAAEYIDLVDRTGRMIRCDKRGAIDADLAPILQRIGVNPEAWTDTVSHFGDRFRLVAGLLPNIRNFADQLGKWWFTGVTAARTAFALTPPQSA